MTAPAVARQLAPGKADPRSQRIIAAGITGLAGKGIALLANALMVPLAVRSLGAEQYGILVTITTTAVMLLVLDLGIANTLTNLISEAYSRDDRSLAAEYFTTAFWTVTAVVILLGIAGWLAWPFIPWASLFHLRLGDEAAPAAVYFVCLAAMPLSLASRIMAGYQEVHLANAFTAAGSVASLVAVASAMALHGGLPYLAVAFSAGPVIGNAACLTWICLSHKPWLRPWPRHYQSAHLRKIFHCGILFFLTQLAALVVLNTDNLIISRYLTPAEVTPYNVAWRLTTYGSSLLALVTPALWPAYAEAFLRGDRFWMRTTYFRTQRATLILLGLLAIAFSLAGKSIIQFWAGPSAVPSGRLLNLMCLWMVVFAVTVNQSSLMGATGRVGRQAAGALLAALTNLALSIWWVQAFGVTGVISATLVSYALFIVAWQEYAVRGILKDA